MGTHACMGRISDKVIDGEYMIFHPVAQRTPEWHALRLGLPTSSEFAKILTPKTVKISASAPDLERDAGVGQRRPGARRAV